MEEGTKTTREWKKARGEERRGEPGEELATGVKTVKTIIFPETDLPSTENDAAFGQSWAR